MLPPEVVIDGAGKRIFTKFDPVTDIASTIPISHYLGPSFPHLRTVPLRWKL